MIGLDILKTGVKIVTNPAGFAAEHVAGRIVERDESGKELPEAQAVQIKLDRIAALLAFMAERMDPDGYKQVFGEDADRAQEDTEWL